MRLAAELLFSMRTGFGGVGGRGGTTTSWPWIPLYTLAPQLQSGMTTCLVRVHAAGVDAGVWHLMTGLPYLVRIMGYAHLRPAFGAWMSQCALRRSART